MKVVKFIFIFLLVIVLLAALGIFIFLKTFDLNRYKDQITTQVSTQIGREVEIGNLDLSFSFSKGIALIVKDLGVKDSADSPSGIWATVESIELQVLLKEYLSDQKLVFSSIRFTTPTIGVDLGQVLSPASTEKKPAVTQDPEKGTQDAEPFDLSKFQLLIQAFEIIDGKVQIKSDGQMLSRDVLVDHIGFKIDNFSIQEPFDFIFRCSALGARNALDAKGRVSLDLSQLQARLDDVVIKSNISELSWEDIRETFASVAASGITAAGGELAVTVSQVILSQQGAPVLTALVDFMNGKIAVSSVKEEIRNIEFHAEYSNQNLEIFKSSLEIGQGRIDVNGGVNDVLGAQNFEFDLDFKNLQLSNFVPDVHPEIHPVALLNGKTHMKGAGLDPEKIRNSLQGQVEVGMTQAKLPEFNLLKFVLSQIAPIPGLAGMVESSLPEKYVTQFNSNETVFHDVNLKSTVSNGIVALPQLRIGSDLFELSSNVQVGFDQKLVFDGSVLIPAALAKDLLEDIPQLGGLKNAEGAIDIPLKHYEGPVQAFKPLPDVGKIGQAFLVEQGKKELNKILGDVFKSPDSSEGAESTVPEGQPVEGQEAPEEKSSEEAIVDTIFDSIFK